MIYDDSVGSAEVACATMPRAPALHAVLPFVNDALAPEVCACLGWVRASVRVGVPALLGLIAISGLPSAWSFGIREVVSPAPVAAAACSALAAFLFAALPRTLDSREPRGAGRQAAIHATVAVAAVATLVASLFGWIAAPSWVTVAGMTLAWFGGILVGIRELAASAIRLSSSPDVVARLERRARSGASVWLVGLAAVGMAAAVSVIGSWHGTARPALALARLVALALSGYACIGLACWAIVFEVALVVERLRRDSAGP